MGTIEEVGESSKLGSTKDADMASGLLPAERRLRILELIQEKGSATTEEISYRFGVSSVTVRRDLAELEREGNLRRTHGGAVYVPKEDYEPPYIIRQSKNKDEKRKIGRRAAGLVGDGEAIYLDIGSTPLEIAKHLGAFSKLTILTSWIPIVLEVVKKEGIQAILLGGEIRKEELSCVGGLASLAVEYFNVDKMFMGVSGISLDKGVTDYNLPEVYIKRQVLERSKEIIVVADHTKFGKVAPIYICPVNKVSKIVTDDAISAEEKTAFERQGVEVIIAS